MSSNYNIFIRKLTPSYLTNNIIRLNIIKLLTILFEIKISFRLATVSKDIEIIKCLQMAVLKFRQFSSGS